MSVQAPTSQFKVRTQPPMYHPGIPGKSHSLCRDQGIPPLQRVRTLRGRGQPWTPASKSPRCQLTTRQVRRVIGALILEQDAWHRASAARKKPQSWLLWLKSAPRIQGMFAKPATVVDVTPRAQETALIALLLCVVSACCFGHGFPWGILKGSEENMQLCW